MQLMIYLSGRILAWYSIWIKRFLLVSVEVGVKWQFVKLFTVLNNIILEYWDKECFKEFHSLMKVIWEGRYETKIILLLEDNPYHEGICAFHLMSFNIL